MSENSGATPKTGARDTPLLGIAWTLAAVFFATLLLTMPKLAGGQVPLFQVAFLRYAAAVAIVGPIYLLRVSAERQPDVQTEQSSVSRWFHVARGVLAAARICCFIYAVTHMPFANAQAITMSNGVFMMVFAALLLHERVRVMTAVAAFICLIGAIIAAEPSSDLTLYLSPAAFSALGGAVLWGLESVMIKYAAMRDRFDRILAIVNIAGTFALLPLAAIRWQPMTWYQWMLILAMGPLAMLTQTSNLKAFRLADANILAPPRYMSIVFALTIGWLLFGEWPSEVALFGIGLVVLGGLTVTLRASRRG